MLFDKAEYDTRMAQTLAAMREQNLGALLLFAPESMYWLTGFDTFGYRFFQCLVVLPNGKTVLLTRSADLRQAQRTSNIDEVHVWIDSANTNPTVNLRDLLGDMNLLGAKLGVEFDTAGLTASMYRLLEERLENFADMEDASSLIHTLRLVKSPAEQVFVREAAAQADRALDAAIASAKPGISEAVVLADMQGSILRDGGDY
ncbi:MAG: aminopeptidase P family N-terminal domain-containing protein, partial [Pseudomonadota bacterium]